jgi:hypothetical protein
VDVSRTPSEADSTDGRSQQPWSTYALHIATFTSLSFVFDPLIIFLTVKATQTWSPEHRWIALGLQLAFMLFSKVVKLVGLFMREPADLVFLPASILFGYFHGLIKLYALCTLRVVSSGPLPGRSLLTPQTSWGSRADGDANDSHRMSPRARRSESITLPRGNHPGLIRYKDDKVFASGKYVETYVDEKFEKFEKFENFETFEKFDDKFDERFDDKSDEKFYKFIGRRVENPDGDLDPASNRYCSTDSDHSETDTDTDSDSRSSSSSTEMESRGR